MSDVPRTVEEIEEFMAKRPTVPLDTEAERNIRNYLQK